MSRYHSHIASAISIVENYNGEEPFVYAIRKFFAANKKYGSKDRKSIGALCYNYFRAAGMLKNFGKEDQFILSTFLCEQHASVLMGYFRPELNEQIGLPAAEKIGLLKLDQQQIFPFAGELSKEIDQKFFIQSFLQQPRLFVRIRPGRATIVEAKLAQAAIEFEAVGTTTLAIKNATSLDEVISINKDLVIQDLSSQQVLDYIDNIADNGMEKVAAWDCCAASGGKAILLYDKLKGKVQLTVSDIRKNILHNCEKRLQQARVEIYKSFVADLTRQAVPDFTDSFAYIICDAPCTGSGTWGRTPEQLFFFNKSAIGDYVQKQQKIACNAMQYLKEGGIFFYITCSVFEKENEGVINFLKQQTGCKVLHQQYVKGYNIQADTMFVAVLSK